MKTIIYVCMIVECLMLIFLTVRKKWTKKAFIAIAALTACSCAALWGYGFMQSRSGDSGTDPRACAYMAARLLQEDDPSDTLNVLSEASEEDEAGYNGRTIRALAYNLNGSYDAAENYLSNGENSEDDESILSLSAAGEPADEDLLDKVSSKGLELVAATEEEARQWEAEMKVRFLGYRLTEDEKDAISSELALVKEDIENYRYDDAYERLMSSGSENVKDAILVSNMYVNNYNLRVMSDTDEEYAALWKEAADIQAELNVQAASLPDDGDEASGEYQEYQKTRAKYDMAIGAVQEESVKRAVNYLKAIESVDAEFEVGYELQLSRLYFMSGQIAEAEECLEKIFTSEALDGTRWLGMEAGAFRQACILYLSDPLNNEYEQLFDGLMDSLYQSVFDGGDASYREFVLAYMKDLFGGFMIKRVNASELPKVSAEVSVTRDDVKIDNESIGIMDTGEEVAGYSVEKLEAGKISLSLVLDRSGSMEGASLAESKNAIRECIAQLSDDISLSFVTFESDSRLECGLTDSKYMVMSLVDGVQTTGGTNIASGLSTAIDSLAAADGSKVIILLSDGVDGDESAEMMDSILTRAAASDIVVFTIGLEGCDEQYLENISDKTGGRFIMVTNTAELNRTYQDIQSALLNNYLITYDAPSSEEESRSITIRGKDSYAEARREYSATEEDGPAMEYVDGIQEAEYYKQIGGTGSGR